MSGQPLGVLMIHGFSGTPSGLGKLPEQVEALHLPYRAPLLKGHGADTPVALLGVKWTEWVADAENALAEVLSEAEKVIVIGHSMGGMIALILAATQGDKIDSIVVAGGSTKAVNPFAPGGPLSFLAPLVLRIKPGWELPPVFADPGLVRYDTGYTWVPTVTFLQLFALMKATHKLVPQVKVPALILHSKKDTANAPEGAQILYDRISTPVECKRLVWFEKTEHLMFLDCEAAEVNRVVVEYLRERLKQSQ